MVFLLLVRPLHQELVGPIPAVPAIRGRTEVPLNDPLPLLLGHQVPPALLRDRGLKGTARRAVLQTGDCGHDGTRRDAADNNDLDKIYHLRSYHYEWIFVGTPGRADRDRNA